MNKNIGLLRGVFDPVHEGHYASMIASISVMQLKKLYIIVKFLGEKDPIASLEQRKKMLNLQIQSKENVKVITQNIRGHIAHLLEFGELYNQDNLIQICGSDKIDREMKVYGKKCNNFLVTKREGFSITSETSEIEKRIGIILNSITPDFSTSSTFIRSELLKNRDKKPIGLNDSVYNFILENDLYILNRWTFNKYVKYWNGFIEFLNNNFPELELFKLNVPDFNQLQHIDGWKEKFIRYIVKHKGLKGNELEEFVKNSLQYTY